MLRLIPSRRLLHLLQGHSFFGSPTPQNSSTSMCTAAACQCIYCDLGFTTTAGFFTGIMTAASTVPAVVKPLIVSPRVRILVFHTWSCFVTHASPATQHSRLYWPDDIGRRHLVECDTFLVYIIYNSRHPVYKCTTSTRIPTTSQGAYANINNGCPIYRVGTPAI